MQSLSEEEINQAVDSISITTEFKPSEALLVQLKESVRREHATKRWMAIKFWTLIGAIFAAYLGLGLAIFAITFAAAH